MSGLSPTVSINALRSQCLANAHLSAAGAAVTPLLRGSRRYHASPTRGRLDPLQRARYYPQIYPDSLSKTLEVQRRMNRPQLVRKVLDTPRDTETIKHLPLNLEEHLAEKAREARSRKIQPPIVVEPLPLPDKASTQRTKRIERRRRRQPERRQSRRQEEFQHHPLLSWAVDESKGQPAQYPWLDHLEAPGSSGLSRLNEEIKAFDAYMSPIPQEDAAARRVQNLARIVLRQAGFPDPTLVGSRQTRTCLRHSDVNLLISVPGLADINREATSAQPEVHDVLAEQMCRVAATFSSSHHFSNTTYHHSCVRSIHTASGISVSIRGRDVHSPSSQYVLSYLSEFPTLRPLYTVLRMVLETRSALGVSNSYVDPYAVLMMIVAALKLGEGTFDRHIDLGRQLLHVLQFYADANFRRYGVSVDPPGLFRKVDPKAKSRDKIETANVRGQESIGRASLARRADMLCLQDPADFMNDLGVECLQSRRMQRVFRSVHDGIQAEMQRWEQEQQHGGPSRVASVKRSDGKLTVGVLQSALGANYDSLERLRDRTVLYLGG